MIIRVFRPTTPDEEHLLEDTRIGHYEVFPTTD